MDYETIIFDVNDGIATITLNRPDRYNALNVQMYKDLKAVLKLVKQDASVRVVVITGTGKGFCSGADLQEIPEPGFFLRDGLHGVILGIRRLEKPVICAINGVAAGAGASLSLACDLRIASEKASFVFAAFVNIGLIPDAGSTHFLPQLIGEAKTFELAMFADASNRLTSEKALEMGIVNRVVPPDDLVSTTTETAQKMAKMATLAIGLAKRAIYRSSERSLEDQLEVEAQMQTIAARSQDSKEGIAAFNEKRDPIFKGE